MRRRVLVLAFLLNITASHLNFGISPLARYHFILDCGELMMLVCGLAPLAFAKRDHPAPVGLRVRYCVALEEYLELEASYQSDPASVVGRAPMDRRRWHRGTEPPQRTSRLVDVLANMGEAAAVFLSDLAPAINVQLSQALTQDFPVAACMGVDLLPLAGAAGLRDTLEMHVGELMASGLVGSELAASRAVSTSHRAWIASMWIRLQLDYVLTTARLLGTLVRAARIRAAHTRILEERCMMVPHPWPYEVELPVVPHPPPQRPARIRSWVLYGSRATRITLFTEQYVQGLTSRMTELIHQFKAEWVHPGGGALDYWQLRLTNGAFGDLD